MLSSDVEHRLHGRVASARSGTRPRPAGAPPAPSRSFADASSRSIAATTRSRPTCTGELRFATTSSSPSRAAAHSVVRRVGVEAEQRGHRARPLLAGPLHRLAPHHDELRARRRATTASAATNAANSPSEWPATPTTSVEPVEPGAPGRPPRRRRAAPAGRTPWSPGLPRHGNPRRSSGRGPRMLPSSTAAPAGCVAHASAIPID